MLFKCHFMGEGFINQKNNINNFKFDKKVIKIKYLKFLSLTLTKFNQI